MNIKAFFNYFSFTFFCFITSIITISAQNQFQIDSLKNLINPQQTDSQRFHLFQQLSTLYESSEIDSSIYYSQKALLHAEKIKNKNGEADCLKSIANMMMLKGEYDASLENELKALQVYRYLNKKDKIGDVLNSIGIIYNYKSNYEKSLDYFLQSLRIREEINDSDGMARVMLNIGNTFNMQENRKTALNYFNQALEIYDKNKEEKNKAFVYNSLAKLYIQHKEYHTALNYLRKSINILKNIKKDPEYPNSLGILSDVYLHLGDYKKSLSYAFQALNFVIANNQNLLISSALNKISNIYQITNQPREALKYAESAMQKANQYQSKYDIQQAAFQLTGIYKNLNDYKKSLEYLELANSIRDDIYNLEKTKVINSLEIDYRIEKQQTQINFLEKARLLKEEGSKNQELQRNFLIIAVLMSTLASIIFLRGSILLKRTHKLQAKQQEEIIAKNAVLEQQKLEITSQAISLKVANEEINLKNEALSLANETLDEKVQERTRILRQQNKQLKEYGFLNAHRLRAPVASVLGLVHLIKISESDGEVDMELIQHLLNATTQLDKIVHEIQDTIEPYYPKKKGN